MIKYWLFSLTTFLVIYSCNPTVSKGDLFGTSRIKGTQFVAEKFKISSGGMYASDIFADYLTDSVNFRIYIGKHNDQESYKYSIHHDSILVKKISIAHNLDSFDVIHTKSFSIKALLKLGIKE